VDVRRTNIQNFNNVEESTCKAECDKNAECTYFVYGNSPGYPKWCWLKKNYNNGADGGTGPNAEALNVCKKVSAGENIFDTQCGGVVHDTCRASK
jgi:hypothetical protein